MRTRLAAYFSLILLCAPAFAQEKVEVVTLRYYRADQIIPLIQPLVGSSGAVTGMQNHLVIRADAAQHAQIRQVLAQIDVAPRRLQISVRQNTTREALVRDSGLYGRIGNERGRVVLPDQSNGDAARIEVRSGRSRLGVNLDERNTSESNSDTQTLQVLEGNPAFIRAGQSIPFGGHRVFHDARGTTVVADTRFIDVVSGFQVLPRVSGDMVTLEIMPQQNSLDTRGAINVQQAATTVTARLGEWIELGGIDQSQSTGSSGTFNSHQAKVADRRGIFLRVDEVK